MQKNKTCRPLEQYLSYLKVIKERSDCTILEYRTDILMFLAWLEKERNSSHINTDFSYVDIEYLQTITTDEMLSFFVYCQKKLNSSAETRARKIVSIRQFWKHLVRSNLINSNPAEQLETSKLPKRIPHYLSLEEAVRLLITSNLSPRDHCILTLLLNCALRISELAALDVKQISLDVLRVIGKGNKKRKIFLTPAAKASIANWLSVRNTYNGDCSALFISRRNTRMTVKALQDVVKEYVVLAGLDSTTISAHTLRHTSATLMYKYGKVDLRSLQQILGHESVATTEIYTHIDEGQLQAAINSNPLAIMFS